MNFVVFFSPGTLSQMNMDRGLCWVYGQQHSKLLITQTSAATSLHPLVPTFSFISLKPNWLLLGA